MWSAFRVARKPMAPWRCTALALALAIAPGLSSRAFAGEGASLDDEIAAELKKRVKPPGAGVRRAAGPLDANDPVLNVLGKGERSPGKKPRPGARPTARASNPDSMDSLLVGALPGDDGATSPSARPRELQREEFTGVMSTLSARVNDCGGALERPVLAELKVEVAPSGSVARVGVHGTLAGSVTAGCIVQTVKTANFPASRGARYPYQYVLKPREPVMVAPSGPEALPTLIKRPEPQQAARTKPVRKPSGKATAAVPEKITVDQDPLSGLRVGRIEGGSKAKRGR